MSRSKFEKVEIDCSFVMEPNLCFLTRRICPYEAERRLKCKDFKKVVTKWYKHCFWSMYYRWKGRTCERTGEHCTYPVVEQWKCPRFQRFGEKRIREGLIRLVLEK